MRDDPQDFDRLEAERFFIALLQADGYDLFLAQRLGFYISQILEDAFPLIRASQKKTSEQSDEDKEALLEKLHLLFNNRLIFCQAERILMHEDPDK